MATPAELQAQRDAILKQMSQPQDVRGPAGMGVTNRNLEDLETALRRIDREIAATAIIRQVRVSTTSGT
jgi:hypothetical protein